MIILKSQKPWVSASLQKIHLDPPSPPPTSLLRVNVIFNQANVFIYGILVKLASRMKPLHFTSEQYLHKAERISPSSVSVLKVICEWPFFKSGDRYSEFLTIGHISFEVSEEGKELSPSQVQYNKHGKYMSLSIKTFTLCSQSFVFSTENDCNIIYEESDN